ncbi:binding-protein-dependent transport systems inner membrane component [Beutenbergia cavernae DSM 12333]|uniref:Binding-protein-dependent transport systems inner membrane component n=1 Tax=Beutenbergia cavernae (strain ATCC BAA-8 / DSM 12333 / CCUG 43141 / JCM 11478 / NBRC 16432 / NCIMB 13614 / HKI 0122) TaxID=471853 RepID=C5BWB3_BEUC1|nr:sugar ABC transporter permease [Beutenbergia cavernae]ACQ78571.1 binding-protein-dependent transport systems inner membrane component [Beutenbergia cavernae DSM 12333]
MTAESLAAPRRRGRPASSTRARQDDRAGRLLVAPTALVVGFVVLLPFAAVLVLAFQDIRLAELSRITFADLGFDLEAFLSTFRRDGFWDSLRATLVFASLTAIGSVALGVAVALALRTPFRGRAIVRGLILMPYVLPVVAAAQTWRTLLNTQYGFVNEFGMRFLGWDGPIAFLTTPSASVLGVEVPLALLSVVLVQIWGTFPLAFLFATARLHAVPGDLEEAASLDGAGAWQRIRYVVLPELSGVIGLLLLLRFIWTFQTFNEVYLLTGGAAGTQVLGVRVYNELIGRADIGSASGVGVAITVMLAGFIALYLILARRRGER